MKEHNEFDPVQTRKDLSQGTVFFAYGDKNVNKIQPLEFPRGPQTKPYKGRGPSIYYTGDLS